ncbi:putative serine hydrolase [Armadillidium nasatum]|uniref:Putative serine hydrolase n=1 Tax=Armadillidium nasatum TaxID=96803 RepID=A0A5N5SPZ6_9CRUS|nr:putative serine hydrolase [Armadillidium nasatum]
MNMPSEVQIQVPYGIVAGKLWNEAGKKTPIIAIHGWMDNAGTWDTLSPLLDNDHPIFALDCPGHGLSFHQPMSSGYYTFDNLITIHKVFHYFKWSKIILLGHSLGGIISFFYAGTMPEVVEKIIIIDILRPIATDPKDQPKQTAASIKELLNVQEKLHTEPPRYEYEEIVKKLMQGYGNSLTEEAAKILLVRNTKEHEDGKYSFTYSPILKVKRTLTTTVEQQKAFVANINCDMLIVKSVSSHIYGSKELAKEFLDLYKKYCRNFELEVVEGTHHLHLVTPEPVAEIVNRFLHGIPQSDSCRKRKLVNTID